MKQAELNGQTLIELVDTSDYLPIVSVSKKQLQTCGVKKKTQRFYFLCELEKIVPSQILQDFRQKHTVYLVKETNLL